MITIDLRSRIAIYEQIKNQIIQLIFIGELKPNEQLPSIRSLSSSLKLNVNTVKRAFQDLEAAGVIYTLTGRGSFISENSLAFVQVKLKTAENIQESIKTGKIQGISKEEVILIVNKIFDN